MGNGDGCTTLSLYFPSLNYTLKIVEMVNFMLYVFDKKKGRLMICKGRQCSTCNDHQHNF